MRDVQQLTSNLAAPCVQAVGVASPSKSYFGGTPSLPADARWPEWHGGKLAFLARISLPQVHAAQPIAWLPKHGALLFFYAADEQPWGFDPKDRGSCAVLHVPDLEHASERDTQGEGQEFFPRMNVAFRAVSSLPSTDRPQVAALALNDEEADGYLKLLDQVHGGLPKHQVGGFPSSVQGDGMELESQLVSNGLYCGDASGYESPRAKELEAGAKDWRLLLQFDTDDDAGVMWGDCGRLYYWVRADEASAGRFENTWLILQCG